MNISVLEKVAKSTSNLHNFITSKPTSPLFQRFKSNSCSTGLAIS